MAVGRAFGVKRSGQQAYPDPQEYEFGPWKGVRDSVDPSTGQPDLLHACENLVPEDPELGGACVSRPGFSPAIGDHTALGEVGHRRCQGFIEVDFSGTIHRILVVGGHVYSYDWATQAATELVLGGSLALELDAVQIYLVQARNYLILSDGVHKPIAWDGSTFAEVTDCPVLYGRPWMYFGAFMGIKDTERDTFVWSRPADPFTGYEAGGYNNAWTLSQTDTNPLSVGVGFNDGMIIWRARSATTITGDIDEEFQSSGTRDGVSETIGAALGASAGVVVAGRNVYFLDADRRPQMLTLDGGIVGANGERAPIWADCRSTLANVPANAGATAIGVYEPLQDVVLLGVPRLGETHPSFFLVFDAPTGQFVGTWTGWDATAIGTWTDLDGKPRLVHGALDGHTYVHGTGEDGVVDDEFVSGAVAVRHYLESGPVGYDTKIEKCFDRVDLSLRVVSTMSNVRVSHQTSSMASSAQALSFSGGLSLWDVAEWDDDVWSGNSAEQHGAAGTAAWGRWTRLIVLHQEIGEPMGIMKARLEAALLGPAPAVP